MPLTPIISKVVTANYVDSQSELDLIPNQIQAMLYLEYNKGTEDYILFLIEFSSISDPTLFFTQSIMTGSDLTVKPVELKFTETNKYRVPIENSYRENKARISIKAVNPGGSPGNVKVYGQSSAVVPPSGAS